MEMTIEQAIKWCESRYQGASMPGATAAYKMCLAALRAQQAAEAEEKPLTLEELRRMDGQPVWIEFIPDFDGEQLKMWALVSVDENDGEVFLLNSIGGSSAYEEVWADIRAIYRRPPVEAGNV